MKRRTALLGLGATATGGTLIGSGAFTSVEADRTVAVEMPDDADAFLSLVPGDENGEYAAETDGTLELNFDATADVTGSGFNQEATTVINDAFQIQNQGTQEVRAKIGVSEGFPEEQSAEAPEGWGVAFSEDGLPSFDPPEAIIIFIIGDDAQPPSFNPADQELEPGDEVSVSAAFIGLQVDKLEDIDEFELVISAEATG